MEFGPTFVRNDFFSSSFREGRDGLARGGYKSIPAEDRFPSKQISPRVQRCLNTPHSASGYSAYQLFLRSNPVDLSG